MQTIASNAYVIYPSRIKAPGTVLLLVLSGLGSLYSLDGLLFFFGPVTLVIFLLLLTNRNAPPTLGFSFIFQWLFYFAQLIDGLFKGKDVQSLDRFSPTRPEVIALGFITISFFFIGIYW